MSCCRLPSLCLLALGLVSLGGGLRAESQALDVIASMKGHTDAVEAVALSPDGLFAATACFDRTVRLFDAATGREVRAYGGPQGHTGQVLSVAFNPKGDQLVSGGADNTAKVWDVPVSFAGKTFPIPAARVVVAADGKTIGMAGTDGTIKILPQGEEKGSFDLKGHTAATTHLAFGGTTWVSAGADKTLRTWAATDGKAGGTNSLAGTDVTGLAVGASIYTTSTDGYLRAWQLPVPPSRSFPALKDGVTAFYANPDGNTLLLATADKTISLGTTANNAVATTFAGTKARADVVALSPDGAAVLAGGADGTLTWWDRQGKLKGELAAHGQGVSGLVFHPSQPLLFTFGGDGLVKAWVLPLDPKQPKEKAQKLELKAHSGKVTGLAILPSGQLITAGADKLIRVWDTTKPDKPVREIGPLAGPITGFALSRDSQLLAAVTAKEIVLRNVADGKETGKLSSPAEVLSLSFSGDKTRLLVGRADNLAALVDIPSGVVVQTFPHAGPVTGVLVHPNGQQVITASADKMVTIAPIGVQRITPLGGNVHGLAISPGLDRLATFGPGNECVTWLAGNGQKDKTFAAGGEALSAAFSKDGQRIAVGGADGSVKLYTVADGKLIGSIAAGGPVSEMAFHPTLPQLAGLVKNQAVVWSIPSPAGQTLSPEFGKPIQSFPHPKGVFALVFNAEGYLFTAGEDKLVRRFRIASELPVKSFPHPNLVDAAMFDPTGTLVATGCHDGNLRIWDVTKGNAVKTIIAHVVTMPSQVQNPIYAVLWTADGKQVFTSSYDRSIKLWDAAAGTLVREFKPVPDAKPEEKKDDKKDKKDDKKDKKDEKNDKKEEPKKEPTGPVGHRDAVFSIALSKDGKMLATASSDKSIKLWDVASAKVIRDFPNPDLKSTFPNEPAPSHPGWVHAVRFTPDGQFLVSAGAAPKYRSYLAVWSVADGRRVYGAERDFGPIHAMELSPDGSKLYIGGALAKGKSEPDVVILRFPGR